MKENLVAADLPIMEYRRRRHELQKEADGKIATDTGEKNLHPTVEIDEGKNMNGQDVWRCRICGYVYDGEELPDGYICPVCGHPKKDYERFSKY